MATDTGADHPASSPPDPPGIRAPRALLHRFFWKILGTFLLLLALSLIVGAASSAVILEARLGAARRDSVQAVARVVAGQVSQFLATGARPDDLPAYLDRTYGGFPTLSVLLALPGGRIIGRVEPGREALRDWFAQEVARGDAPVGAVSRLSGPMRGFSVTLPMDGVGPGASLLVSSSGLLPEAREATLEAMAVSGAGVISVAALLGIFVFRALTARLGRVRDAMAAVEAGDLTQRVIDPVQDELGDLARSFNAMAARLALVVGTLSEVDERRRQFLADIAHELKTPLTSLRGQLELLAPPHPIDSQPADAPLSVSGPAAATGVASAASTAGGTTTSVAINAGGPAPGAGPFVTAAAAPATRSDTPGSTGARGLSIALEEMERLGLLVDDLLELARMEAPTFTLHCEELAIQRVVSSAIARVERALSNRGVKILTHLASEPLYRKVDRRRVEQALANLIQNALASISPSGTIEISVVPEGDRARLIVDDDGRGISPDQLERVFERFHTGRGAAGGTGLGLSIVQQVARAHGGRVWLEPRAPRGTRAVLEL